MPVKVYFTDSARHSLEVLWPQVSDVNHLSAAEVSRLLEYYGKDAPFDYAVLFIEDSYYVEGGSDDHGNPLSVDTLELDIESKQSSLQPDVYVPDVAQWLNQRSRKVFVFPRSLLTKTLTPSDHYLPTLLRMAGPSTYETSFLSKCLRNSMNQLLPTSLAGRWSDPGLLWAEPSTRNQFYVLMTMFLNDGTPIADGMIFHFDPRYQRMPTKMPPLGSILVDPYAFPALLETVLLSAAIDLWYQSPPVVHVG